MEHATALIILALVFGFYMAWNIGANDVANAMGTSVGSGALTFKRAVIIAAILEFAGAFFVGSHVSDTVRKGIVDPMLFTGDPQAFVLGMLSALLAAGVWLQVATMFGWPVSTTHSIVGAIIGFGIVYGGMSIIHWDEVGKIAASWIVSPLMSGVLSFIIFQIVLRKVFYKSDPVAAVRKFAPYMVFLVLAMMTLVMVFKGLKNLHLDLSLTHSILVSCGIGLIGAVATILLLRNYKSDESDEEQLQARELYVARTLQRANKHLLRAMEGADTDTRASIDAIIKQTSAATDISTKRANLGSSRQEFRRTERIFVFLQILTACFIAFAHGANDVANAIGPLSAVVQTVQAGHIDVQATVPLWALLLGGAGIVIGLATYGWRVMETVGKKITELTPSRGFCAMFGAATTVVLASKLALPISTTHTLVGAVLGVGLARGFGALNLSIVRDIALSWVITIPAGAILAIIFYKTLEFTF